METAEWAEIQAALGAQRLPRWSELPDLELYMDQLLGLIGRYLGDYPGYDKKGLTASMVNNYVKLGLVPPPVKKRYGREQLSCLIIVCLLKAIFPIAAIRQLLDGERARHQPEELYDVFCQRFEATLAVIGQEQPKENDSPYAAILRAALRAQAERALALKLFAEHFPDPSEKEKA